MTRRVNDARKEFGEQRKDMTILQEAAEKVIQEVKTRMTIIEGHLHRGGGGHRGTSTKGYLPMESTVPDICAGRLEEWREWNEEVEECFGTANPGMKSFLRIAAKEEGDMGEEWKGSHSEAFGARVTGDKCGGRCRN